MSRPTYIERLNNQVLIFDGAMGTSIQRYNLTPADFGGQQYEGCNDYLVITRPDVVSAIHASKTPLGTSRPERMSPSPSQRRICCFSRRTFS